MSNLVFTLGIVGAGLAMCGVFLGLVWLMVHLVGTGFGGFILFVIILLLFIVLIVTLTEPK